MEYLALTDSLKKRPEWALLSLPAFLLLHDFNELFGYVSTKPEIIYALIIYSILGVLYFLTRRKGIAGVKNILILFVLSLFFLIYQPIHEFSRMITFNSFLSNYLFLFPLWIVIIILVVRRILKVNSISQRFISFLNILMICLLIFELSQLLLNILHFRRDKYLIYPDHTLSKNYSPSGFPDSAKPDIYFLVFDEYTNNHELQKVWNYKNENITNWLTGQGFHVPQNTRSNYSFTLYSISSTLNMDYLDKKKGADGTVKKNLLQANESLSENETFNILKKEDYSIRFIAPFPNSVEENGLDNIFSDIYNEFTLQTLPGSLYKTIRWRMNYGKFFSIGKDKPYGPIVKKNEQLLNTIDMIKKTTNRNSNRKPQMVYGHIMSTHLIHLFDSTGHLMSKKEATESLPIETYPHQIDPTNKIIRELIEFIQQHNKPNTIIIIEGDHGFRSFVTGSNWFERTPDSLKAYFLPNFSAIYFPDKDYHRIYDSITPVNTFRVLFDQFFQQRFPLLRDTSILVKDE